MPKHQAPTFIEFRGPTGEVLFADTTGDVLLVFVDDTGHETFADTQYPVFGLGGCAALSVDYASALRDPWLELKRMHCGGEEVLLHAADFQNHYPGAVKDFADFFRHGNFFRFAAVTTTAAQLWPTELLSYGSGPVAPAYEQVTVVLRLRLKELIENSHRSVSRVVMIVEASQRTDPLASRYFGQFAVAPPYDQLPIELFRCTKTLNEPGLEVADFVVHTAGAQTRHKQTRSGWRKDFQAIFQESPQELISFLELDSLHWRPQSGPDLMGVEDA